MDFSEIFSNLDIHFARFIHRIDNSEIDELFLTAALVSNYNRQGHICLDLKGLSEKHLFDDDNGNPVVCPTLKTWQEKLQQSTVVGRPGEFKPLILDKYSNLYLYRYWDYQDKLAGAIKARLDNIAEGIDFEMIKKSLDQFFPAPSDSEVDWQRIAAFTSFVKKFCVISGGPGTGKTTTITKIIAFLQDQNQSLPLKIALATPTGKAAARLQEAIKITKARLNCSPAIKNLIPEETATIHRLLGTIPNSPYFRYNAEHPLPIDVMIIDEASMVDLALMSKLVQALPAHCRLILVGDKDQLASVEAGAVLGDICDTGNPHSYSRQFLQQIHAISSVQCTSLPVEPSEAGIQDCIIELKKSYRFARHSGISAVSQAVNKGDGGQAAQLLRCEECPDVRWISLPPPNQLAVQMKNSIIQGFKDYLNVADPFRVFQFFDQFRILCALREGPYGVKTMNAMVENILKAEKLIDPQKSWYHGRPIMITSNNYNLQLFNGDIGMALKDPLANDDIRVFFISPDGSIKKFHPMRLPAHETVYALTVHKSQGSEFDHVMLLLPDRDSPVLTRELIYTAITRARKKVEIWGIEPIFKTAVSRRIKRTSGLRDALWNY